MNTALTAALAAGLYVAAAVWWGVNAFRPNADTAALKLRLMVMSAAALVLHAAVLWHTVITGVGINMGFYNALSLMGWVVALIVTVAALVRPVENLALMILPASAGGVLLETFFTSDRMVTDPGATGLLVHILLSIGAYGLLALAAVQALVLSFQDRLLRHRRPASAMRLLPPLQTMEEMLVQVLALGFFLLSLSVATGLIFVHDLMAQHLVHKTVFSLLAWLLFGTVLLGRWVRGWRGQRLVLWTLGGFVSLVLAYFGTKLVLELILERV
jgi:ABC-type uncharacterized transport system permease subunit